MGQSISQKRPWLAALLAALVTGLGHAYLRRWRRAFGWLAVAFLTTALFVDPTVVDTVATGGGGLDELVATGPMLLVVGLSIVDAYLLARAQTVVSSVPNAASEESHTCPHCGNELDDDLEFCHWCTESLEGRNGDHREEPATDDRD
ncbi:zinc ribbon domain-containing protein [Natronorubrum aibiense]|uniref:Zinc ribbon domain-containing protein n=1 Tax=Natronorubrum aibiense TaxID=348826 RepID=A0A5P9P933_9EURY|nr:zinc ribbon domain-containing protein [Natronorubrum aibiense]QFU84649.1 zinc ribbon domain-containing protein [Natronorubrum aibiense]